MIYDFKVKKTNGEEILLEKYKGKVLLIVNTASGCGFTPQYEGLQKIYDEYKDMKTTEIAAEVKKRIEATITQYTS